MANEIVVQYGDTEINYNEQRNRWEYEKNGRNSSAESLESAKKNIDTESKKDAKKAFQRVEAYQFNGHNPTITKVTVTSIAESNYRSPEVWIVDENGSRRKVYASSCYPVTPDSTHKFEILKALKKQIDTAQENFRRLRDSIPNLEKTAEELQDEVD